jgi:hypothetical protein
MHYLLMLFKLVQLNGIIHNEEMKSIIFKYVLLFNNFPVVIYSQSTLRFQNNEFTITTGIINVLSDNKEKHLCIAIASTKLPKTIQLKSYE